MRALAVINEHGDIRRSLANGLLAIIAGKREAVERQQGRNRNRAKIKCAPALPLTRSLPLVGGYLPRPLQGEKRP